MAVLGLRFCARAFSSCSKWGPLFIVVRGPLTIAASLVAEHRLQKRRLSNCGSRAQLLRGIWDPPKPGLEPMSPALAQGSPQTHTLTQRLHIKGIISKASCHFESNYQVNKNKLNIYVQINTHFP